MCVKFSFAEDEMECIQGRQDVAGADEDVVAEENTSWSFRIEMFWKVERVTQYIHCCCGLKTCCGKAVMMNAV